MIILGAIIFALAVATFGYCYYSCHTLSCNTPRITREFGVLLFLIPIALAIISVLVSKWYALIGLPIGWLLWILIYRKGGFDLVGNGKRYLAEIEGKIYELEKKDNLSKIERERIDKLIEKREVAKKRIEEAEELKNLGYRI
jgi:hypothetical protein